MIGRLILCMARSTISQTGMTKVYAGPIGRNVAIRTLAIEMVGGLILGVTGDTICGAGNLVIEVNVLPGDRRVACSAVARKMYGGFVLSVAGNTGVRSAGKTSVCMASFASQLCVFPHQGEECVFGARTPGRELYRMGIHCTRRARCVTAAQQRG